MKKSVNALKRGIDCRLRSYTRSCNHDCRTCNLYIHNYSIQDRYKDVLEYISTAEEKIKKLTPSKVLHEASLYRCGTCPTCHNVVSDFEKWGDKTILITVAYCKFCGQALDWEGFSMEPKTNAIFCPNYIHETGTCYFEQSHHCDYIENCKFMPPSGSSTPDAQIKSGV